MIRRAFLKRVAFAALATALFDKWVPEIQESWGGVIIHVEDVWRGQWIQIGDEVLSPGIGTVTAVKGNTITVEWSTAPDGTNDHFITRGRDRSKMT